MGGNGAEKKNENWALVTGASAGLGWVFVEQLVARGMPVLAVARREDRLQALVKRGQELGGRVEYLAEDLTSPGAVERVVKAASELGHVELLVNNAGYGDMGPFWERSLEKQRGMLRLNIEVLVELTHRLVPGMVEARQGGVINLASVVGFQPQPWMSIYAATKAFVLSFSQALAEELRGTGVNVVASCPGPTETEFNKVAGTEEAVKMAPIYMKPEPVVAQALRAYDKGRVVKVHGLLNTAGAILTPRAPKSIVRWFAGKLLKEHSRKPSN